MFKHAYLIIGISILSHLLFFSCAPSMKSAERFKEGVFEIPAGEGYEKTIITRIDSLQIEQYTKLISMTTDSGIVEKQQKRIDTLFIQWKNNFFYTLKMKSPKKEIDTDPIFVQITKVTDSMYEFTAKIGFSNFEQKGTVYKIK